MTTVQSLLKPALCKERGAVAIEYALVVAFIAAAVAFFFSAANTDNPLRYFFPL